MQCIFMGWGWGSDIVRVTVIIYFITNIVISISAVSSMKVCSFFSCYCSPTDAVCTVASRCWLFTTIVLAMHISHIILWILVIIHNNIFILHTSHAVYHTHKLYTEHNWFGLWLYANEAIMQVILFL